MWYYILKVRFLGKYGVKMRTILHSDLNNFYASVELLKHPDVAHLPVVVCGNVEDRHGIVLAKNQIAKSLGVKTGEVLWQAEKKCKNLVRFTADFPSYLKISKAVKEIYSRYTDQIESFGIDECWLDVTDSRKYFGTGEEIAQKIRSAVKEEIGVTVSVGVSFNKIFAKLGSDMKKPDAVTVISKENYKDTVWKLPAEDLLYVGRATKNKLNSIGVHTIGDIATTDEKVLVSLLGVWGHTLYTYANGLDNSPVISKQAEDGVKSISNSLTAYKDLCTFEEVKTLILLLAESVATRLRESGLGKASTVKLSVVDNSLKTVAKQVKLTAPTKTAGDIANACYKLFYDFYKWVNPVRGLGVGVSNFTFGEEQLSIDFGGISEDKKDRLDEAVDEIRAKYGNNSVQRARILQDKRLSGMDVKGDHLVSFNHVEEIKDD